MDNKFKLAFGLAIAWLKGPTEKKMKRRIGFGVIASVALSFGHANGAVILEEDFGTTTANGSQITSTNSIFTSFSRGTSSFSGGTSGIDALNPLGTAVSMRISSDAAAGEGSQYATAVYSSLTAANNNVALETWQASFSVTRLTETGVFILAFGTGNTVSLATNNNTNGGHHTLRLTIGSNGQLAYMTGGSTGVTTGIPAGHQFAVGQSYDVVLQVNQGTSEVAIGDASIPVDRMALYIDGDLIVDDLPLQTAATDASAFRMSVASGSSATANTQSAFEIDNIEISNTINAVPEPASLSALALGGLLLSRRRRRSR